MATDVEEIVTDPPRVPEPVIVRDRVYQGTSHAAGVLYEVQVGSSYATLTEAQELHARVRAALAVPGESNVNPSGMTVPPPAEPPCSLCGGPHPFETTVPSVVWNRVVRQQGLPEYLCLTCIVKAFSAAGESFTAQLWGGNFEGQTIEVRIGGAAALYVAELSDENTRLRGELDACEQHVKILQAQRAALAVPVVPALPACDCAETWHRHYGYTCGTTTDQEPTTDQERTDVARVPDRPAVERQDLRGVRNEEAQ
jgi:hypothetical protein